MSEQKGGFHQNQPVAGFSPEGPAGGVLLVPGPRFSKGGMGGPTQEKPFIPRGSANRPLRQSGWGTDLQPRHSAPTGGPMGSAITNQGKAANPALPGLKMKTRYRVARAPLV